LLKQITVIGLSGFALVASPVSANETSAIAGTVAAGVAQALVCTAAAIYSHDDEADPEAYDRPGFFVGVGGSYAFEELSGEVFSDLSVAKYTAGDSGLSGEMTDDLSFNDSWGINGQAGYRCHPRFSAEIEVEWIDEFDANVNKAFSGKVGTTEVEPIVITANATGYLLTGRTQPFLRAGLGLMRVEYTERDTTSTPSPDGSKQRYNETRFALRVGGGIDYYATKNVVVGVDVDYVVSPSLDVQYVTVGAGIQYRF